MPTTAHDYKSKNQNNIFQVCKEIQQETNSCKVRYKDPLKVIKNSDRKKSRVLFPLSYIVLCNLKSFGENESYCTPQNPTANISQLQRFILGMQEDPWLLQEPYIIEAQITYTNSDINTKNSTQVVTNALNAMLMLNSK